MSAVIWPSTEKFNNSIRDGSLDYTLLQPADSMFLVTFSSMVIWRVWDLVLAIVLIVVGINMSGGGTSPINLLSFIFLAVSGAVILYSLWLCAHRGDLLVYKVRQQCDHPASAAGLPGAIHQRFTRPGCG